MVDERRRQLTELQRLAERLRQDVAALGAEFAREKITAAASIEAGRTFPAYAERVRQRHTSVLSSIADVDAEVNRAEEGLREAYRALKRHEVALANREAREAAATQRKEQIVGDDVGIEMHRRRR
jgi:flagellar export protein FliJ